MGNRTAENKIIYSPEELEKADRILEAMGQNKTRTVKALAKKLNKDYLFFGEFMGYIESWIEHRKRKDNFGEYQDELYFGYAIGNIRAVDRENAHLYQDAATAAAA